MGSKSRKSALGLIGGVPRRVDAATKLGVLDLLDHAVEEGWDHRRACALLGVRELRARRWRRRRDRGRLDDLPGGGGAVHGLLDHEVTAIVALADEWGPVDRSHRKLAHRGSYLGLVWVSPTSVRRVLASLGRALPRPRPRTRSERRPWPDWVTYRPNQVWGWDVTHFTRARRAVFAIVDLVSRRWIAILVSAEETSTQVEIVFTAALETEGLLTAVALRLDGTTGQPLADPADDNPARPILLAVSDNGPQMTSGSTREFMALCSIAQHFGRPGVPTDQAPIESFFGHLKGEWPHLEDIREPDLLRVELERVRREYNGVRLHAGIGYVTPDDEHHGRGAGIRAARRRGLEQARLLRIAHRRTGPHGGHHG